MRKRITLTVEAMVALDELRAVGVTQRKFLRTVLPNIAPPDQVRLYQASVRCPPTERIARDSAVVIERAQELRELIDRWRRP